MSPTSNAETKPFFPERSNGKSYSINGASRAIGLGIIDSLAKETSENRMLIQTTRMVLLGPQIKINASHLKCNSSLPTEYLEFYRTPIEFGVKNKNIQLPTLSPAGLRDGVIPNLPVRSLSPVEIEFSEDYTCVISYGSNPKKTHIFNNYLAEWRVNEFAASKNEVGFSDDQGSRFFSADFLRFCHGCKKNLEQGKDIFMYRGDRAFCSHECRQMEMMSDDDSDGVDL